jgi:hypothetical protein
MTEGNTIPVAREHDATTAAVHDLDFAADAQPQRQQTPTQIFPAIDADQAQALTHYRIGKRHDTRLGHWEIAITRGSLRSN